jgi:predicted permease
MTRLLHALRYRLRALADARALDRELDAELAEHLAAETDALIARGLSREDAARRARQSLGVPLRIAEECRDARGVRWWEHLRQDAGFAVRLLSRRKTFTAIAVGTMALAIGASTAVYTVVDTILLRPLPYPQPERLVATNDLGMYGAYAALRAASRTTDYAAHRGIRSFNLVPPGQMIPERVTSSEISPSLTAVLGAAPLVGRAFSDHDRHAVIVSRSFWMTRLAGDPTIVGRSLNLDGADYQVVGVMPQGFAFPSADVDLWVPLVIDPTNVGAYWGAGGVSVVGRLRPEATLDTARAELRVQIPRIRAMFPWRMPDLWGAEATLRDMRELLVADVRPRTLTLLGVVALLLLIAVTNVANLMIAQTTARWQEIVMRTALGASVSRLTRQLLTEAFVLAAAGGGCGIALAYAAFGFLRKVLPGTPRLEEVSVDHRVLAVTTVTVIVTGLLVGLWPAWRVRGTHSFATSGRGATTGRTALRADALLVMAEAALATLLLVASGLLLHSLWVMSQVRPGFRVESVVTAQIARGTGSMRWPAVRDRLLEYPGVRAAAAMNVLPMTAEVTAFAAAIEDHPVAEGDPAFVLWSTVVTPEHRAVLDIPLVEGRAFTETDRDGTEPVVLVSRSTARRFWPGRSPVGRRLKPVWDRQWRTIVGVLDNVRTYGVAGPPDWIAGEVYVPLAQNPGDQPLSLIARVDGDPAAFRLALPALVYDACHSCAVSKIAAMDEVVADAVAVPRSTAQLVGGFALLALVLAGAGIYGVVNHGVIRRTRELGIRLALGAGRARVAAAVVAASLSSVLAGSAIGLVAAAAVSRLLQSLLFAVGPHDPLSFAAAPALLLLITGAAAAMPVVRALHIDPVKSLREQ